jgi:phosphoribosylaminoimidazole-succinocarboxamide synthase
VLTQMSKFAMSFLSREVSDFRHHLLPDDFTSFGPDLPSERVTRVRQLNMWDAEIILRAYLGGSVWGQYQQTGLVAGQQLGTGLRKWEKMHPPLFTPSTKAKVGHDQNITQDRFYAQLGARARDGIDMFTRAFMAYSTYVERHGFTLLDTKGEIGYEGDDQYAAVVADEIFTPDCSRFTTSDDLALARKEGRDPVAYDKQLVRAWGMTVETPFGFTGIHRLDPENPEHLAFVDSLQVPQEVLEETAKRYREICRAITGIDLR